MRIVVGGDRDWRCDDLATSIVRRLIARYGPDIVIVHGGSPGVDESFPVACRALGVAIDFRMVDFARAGDHKYQHREMLKPGVGLCAIVCRAEPDERAEDLAKQAMAAGVPTYRIADERGRPWRWSPAGGV